MHSTHPARVPKSSNLTLAFRAPLFLPRSCEIGDGVRLSNCVILNRVAIKNFSLIQDSIIGWSSKSEQGRWFGGRKN